MLVVPTDVSSLEQVQRLKDKAYEAYGEVCTCPLLVCLLYFIFSIWFSWFLAQFRRNRRLTSEHVRS